ncbi:TPA: MFS transporter [Klebsiella pneumoniae]|nr:MFS transporter [Klebsiella pneumoniae]HDQ3433186.1 MFS transporter [Klebsiella pneumoniae]
MNGNQIDVREWLDKQPLGRYQYYVLLLGFLIIFIDGYDTAVMGFIIPSLVHQWQLTPAQAGMILGSAMTGVALGALIAGNLADRYGRKKVLLIALALVSVLSLAGAAAQSPQQLALCRFLAGMGLGAVMPVCVTFVAEYVPARCKSTAMTAMYSGFSLGSGGAGLLAAWMLQHFHWGSLLLIGGVIPAGLLLLLLVTLSESPMYLWRRASKRIALCNLLNRLGGHFTHNAFYVQPYPVFHQKNTFRALFSDGFSKKTLVLWFTYLFGLFTIYLLNGWMPNTLNQGGFSLTETAWVASGFQLGGIAGCLVIGYLMDKFSAARMVSVFYLVGATILFAAFVLDKQFITLLVLIFFSGIFINGAQTGMQSIAPSLYPTAFRATGVSCMHGIGRIGAIASSSLGGVLLYLFPGESSLYCFLATSALIASLLIINLNTTIQPLAEQQVSK